MYGYRCEYKYQAHIPKYSKSETRTYKISDGEEKKRKFGKKSLQVIELISRVEVFAIFMSFHKWPQYTKPFVPFTIRENISHAIHLLFIESLINFQCFWFLFGLVLVFRFVCVCVCVYFWSSNRVLQCFVICWCLLMFVYFGVVTLGIFLLFCTSRNCYAWTIFINYGASLFMSSSRISSNLFTFEGYRDIGIAYIT